MGMETNNMPKGSIVDSQIDAVRLDDAHKVYQMGRQEVRALNGVSVHFGRGSFWAIMGPSGSGKSTMMNILGCLDRLTEGSYSLQGRDVGMLDDDALSELRLRQLGFIFQSFNLIPQLTVQRNIELPLYYLGWEATASTQRAFELAEKVGLSDRIDHRPTELSGGPDAAGGDCPGVGQRPTGDSCR